MRLPTLEGLALTGKTVALVVGMILLLAALVELSVAGWSTLAGAVLLGGLLLAVPPLAFAFRDAVRAGRPSGEEEQAQGQEGDGRDRG